MNYPTDRLLLRTSVFGERNQADIVLNSFWYIQPSTESAQSDYLYSWEPLNISNRVKHSFPYFTFVWRDRIDARNTVVNNRKFRKEQNVSCDRHWEVAGVALYTVYDQLWRSQLLGRGGGRGSSIETSDGPGSYSSSSQPNCGERGDSKGRQELATLKEAHVAGVKAFTKRLGERRSHWERLWLLPILPSFAPDEYFDLVWNGSWLFWTGYPTREAKISPCSEFIHNLKRGPHFRQ